MFVASPLRGFALSIGFLLSFNTLAHAQGRASDFLERRHREVNRVLQQHSENSATDNGHSARLGRLLGDLLDYESLSRESLSEHWEGKTEEQREEFISLLRQLVQRSYENNLARTLEYEVNYERQTEQGDLTVVHTVARSRTQRRQPPVEIRYAMHRVGGDWRVVDVDTDGVSMVQNYRRQFNRIISRDGWDALIERMRNRLSQHSDR